MIPSPNIWHHPEVYEVENTGVDPDQRIEAAIDALHAWSGARVLDIGCGAGFHLPRFAALGARSVVGIEPYAPLADRARARVAGADGIEVVQAGAESLPLHDGSVDIVHARWAYFFGPGCEPGLAEVERVLAPGGVVCIIDNDATRSTFGRWFADTHPAYDPAGIERFWRRQGFTRIPLDIDWAFGSRADFEAVVRIEFAPADAEAILAEHDGAGVDYAVNLWWRRGGPVGTLA